MNELKSLQVLAEPGNRETILLAEIAALLHNIGKLDPNFLAKQVTSKDEAQQKIEERLLDIPHYCFDRFAAPDRNLLVREKDLIALPRWSPEQKQQLTQDLQSELGLEDEFISSCVEAAERFRDFLYSNGPLFRCFSPERKQRLSDLDPFRQEIDAIENELARLNQELAQIHASFDQATDQQRKQLGLRSNKLQENQKQLIQRKKQKEEAFKGAHEQFKQAIPEEEKETQSQLEGQFRKIRLEITGETWSVADLLTLFWDDFFHQPPGDPDSGYKRRSTLAPWLSPNQGTRLPALLILSHGEVSGEEKPPKEKRRSPLWEHLRFATAFGYERDEIDKWALHDARHRLLDFALQACAAPSKERDAFMDSASKILEMGLGDTQWPINEINLWDYSTSIATLFKAAIAKAVLENRFVDLKDVKWRLLSIRYDGLRYLAQAHRLSDLLARRDLLMAAHEEVLALIEVEYPLGNKVYRDENGAVLVVPHVMGEDGQNVDLLALPAGDESNLKSLIETRFGRGGHHPLEGELQPLIALSQELPGKGLKLHQAPGWTDPPLHSNPTAVTKWWKDEKRQGEVCTVCGLRPMGYGAPEKDWQRHLEEEHHPGRDPLHCKVCKAQSRSVCWVCMERREDRSHNWVENRDDEQTHTIWTDEVADANGRFALLVGRFDLDGWLDGTLIPTMQKPDSFARICRCWETTRQFWDDVEKRSIPQWQKEDDTQKGIIPANQRRLRIDGHFAPAPGTQGLGRYHVYELDVEGISLSAVWVPQDGGGYFLTADNLCYVARQLGATEHTWCNSLTAASFVMSQVTRKDLTVNEPSGYSVPASKRGTLRGATATGTELPAYTPYIPVLAQPSTFMALVPADRAVAVARHIKEKYETEIGKVRDRLPLHLGLVFAPRRTLLRAVLEAGRAMLGTGKKDWRERGDTWKVASLEPESWDIDSPPSSERKVIFVNGIEWTVPMRMGDEHTPDRWYPHLLTKQPEQGQALALKHVAELEAHQQVWVRPSTFDFVFLDTTGRRFDLNYAQGQRQRLYLEQLDELETLWHLLAGKPEGADSRVRDGWQGLTNTQIHGLNGLIEAKREEWNVAEEGDPDGTFAQLVRDALARANWPGKNGGGRLGKLTGIADAQERLVKAGVDGTLARTIELHSSILKLESQCKEKEA